MTRSTIVFGSCIPGTNFVLCSRCGEKIDTKDKEAKRLHAQHHKNMDQFTKRTGIDPLRHDECVDIESKAPEYLSRPDLLLRARGVFELLMAEYSRDVMKKIKNINFDVEYFDEFMGRIDLDDRYKSDPKIANALRYYLKKQYFGYVPTRAACERFVALHPRTSSRRRRGGL
jgi:hypothetical protein